MIETAVLPEREGTREKKRPSEHPRIYFCTTLRYCNYHLQKGSKMVRVQNDKFRPGRLVFCFLWDETCEENAKSWENGDRESYIG